MMQANRRELLEGVGIAGAVVGGGLLGARLLTPDSGEGPLGRIDPLGHELRTPAPAYTFGHVSDDGRWGALGSFPRADEPTASTLYDLEDLGAPEEVHRVDAPNELTRTNHLRFDGTRSGLYYRTLEADDVRENPQNPVGHQGIEVVDFGWGDGSPEEPEVIATVETPNTGVHTIGEHPDETVIYLIDKTSTEPGVIPLDVSDPTAPELGALAGPPGYCHATEVDPVRDVLHCAYIDGDFEGYAILDIEDPLEPDAVGRFDYAEQPDYETIHEPGFEYCHQAMADPERGIAIIGDEVQRGIPGGKHVFDIGWGDGSLEDPRPIGFVRSPDARFMDDDSRLWWTTHFHDLIPTEEATLLVDGGYRNGVWLADVSAPEEPRATERYATIRGADRVEADEEWHPETPPFAWSAVYNEEREFVFVSDTLTGAYTFEVSAEPARGPDGHGPDGHYDVQDR